MWLDLTAKKWYTVLLWSVQLGLWSMQVINVKSTLQHIKTDALSIHTFVKDQIIVKAAPVIIISHHALLGS